jgi:hypothetical protein
LRLQAGEKIDGWKLRESRMQSGAPNLTNSLNVDANVEANIDVDVDIQCTVRRCDSDASTCVKSDTSMKIVFDTATQRK